jgi:hypothetical protein
MKAIHLYYDYDSFVLARQGNRIRSRRVSPQRAMLCWKRLRDLAYHELDHRPQRWIEDLWLTRVGISVQRRTS